MNSSQLTDSSDRRVVIRKRRTSALSALRFAALALLLLPVLAACGFGSDDSGAGQISWVEGTRPPDGIAPPAVTDIPQPTAAATMVTSATESAPVEAPTTAPTTPPEPTVAPTQPAAPTSAPVTGQLLTPEQLAEFQPNELGTVPVFMYHNIVQEYGPGQEGDVLYRTEAEFRDDLQFLYDNNFYIITIQEYVENRISAPAGKHPAVLIFDDSRPNQFYYDIAADGSVTIDPNSAIGILEDFFATHPDFGHTAAFAVIPIWCFDFEAPDQTPYCQQKLQWLVDNGYEVANHTWDHQQLSDVPNEVFQQKVGDTVLWLQEQSGQVSASNALILPYGLFPDTDINPDALQQWRWARNGFDYNGNFIQLSAMFAAGAEPAPSPNSVSFDPMSIARIGAKDDPGPGEGNLFLNFWFGQFVSRPDLLYVSDGNPETITVPEVLPAELEGTLDEEKIAEQGKELIRY